jgi:Spy/CpxP family protein refolding chaperone
MKESVESLGRVRAQGIVLLLVMFAVGVLAGIAIERVRIARSAPPAPPFGMGQPWAEGHMPMMFRELDLTPEQRQQIGAILQESRPRTQEILREMLPRLRAVTDSVRDEVRAVLTAEQAARLDSLMAEMRPRQGQMRGAMPGRRGRRGPPPPGR